MEKESAITVKLPTPRAPPLEQGQDDRSEAAVDPSGSN